MIAVIVNPRSRANRRNPRIAAEFQAILGDRGRVFAPKSIEELDATAAELHESPPSVLAPIYEMGSNLRPPRRVVFTAGPPENDVRPSFQCVRRN